MEIFSGISEKELPHIMEIKKGFMWVGRERKLANTPCSLKTAPVMDFTKTKLQLLLDI